MGVFQNVTDDQIRDQIEEILELADIILRCIAFDLRDIMRERIEYLEYLLG